MNLRCSISRILNKFCNYFFKVKTKDFISHLIHILIFIKGGTNNIESGLLLSIMISTSNIRFIFSVLDLTNCI